MTNYEKIIASLTPERLAEEIEKQGCATCPLGEIKEGEYCKPEKCLDCILDWLKQEAE